MRRAPEVWVAMVTLVLGLMAWTIATAARAGEVEARVKSLEDTSEQQLRKAEFEIFAQDVRARLDRIERKLDSKESKNAR